MHPDSVREAAMGPSDPLHVADAARGGAALLYARLQRAGMRHPDWAAALRERLEQRRRAAGDLPGALDALCERFALLEHAGRALDLAEPLARAAAEADAAALQGAGARIAEARGRTAYQQGHYFLANEQWSRALDLAEACGARRTAVAARIGLGQVHYAMGAWNGGLRFHREALAQLGGLSGDSDLAAKVALNIGVGQFEIGQLEDAERHFAHGLAAARRGGHREFEAEAHWHLARAALARGQMALATTDCRLALSLAARLRHAWLEGAASRTWTEIELARGDEAGAVRSTQHALALAERIASRPQQSAAHRQLARLLERQGDLAGALAHLWRHVALEAEAARETVPEAQARPVTSGETPHAATPPTGSPSAR
jgi:tetratricopeptide (TPR) repeat protein